MNIKNLITVAICLLFSTLVNAQDSKYQLRAEFYKHINPFSFANDSPNGFHYPKDLGFAVGVERDYRNKKRIRTYQTATVGFFNEPYLERTITVESKFGLSWKVFKGLNVGFEAGAGYQRAKSSNLIAVYEGNKWISKVDKSVITNRVSPELGLNIGYDFSKHFGGKLPISISAATSGNVLYPYLPDLDFNLGINRRNTIMLKYRF